MTLDEAIEIVHKRKEEILKTHGTNPVVWDPEKDESWSEYKEARHVLRSFPSLEVLLERLGYI